MTCEPRGSRFQTRASGQGLIQWVTNLISHEFSQTLIGFVEAANLRA